MAAQALDAGHAVEDVARATSGVAWSFAGRESDYWARWIEAFNRFSSHHDPRIRRVGEIGVENAQAWLQDA